MLVVGLGHGHKANFVGFGLGLALTALASGLGHGCPGLAINFEAKINMENCALCMWG